MRSNVGGIDKVVRIGVGLAALGAIFVLPESYRWWGLVGLVPLATGLMGWCPAYPLLGLNSCPATRRR